MAAERPEDLALTVMPATTVEAVKPADPAETVIWFEEPTATFRGVVGGGTKAVEAGATLVFSGKSMPLLEAFARRPANTAAPARPDVVFEDFEHGYDNGRSRAGLRQRAGRGNVAQPTTGHRLQGQGLANSYIGGDDATGRLISRPFTIERNYIRFLIGGGAHPTTQLRLLVEGRSCAASGGNNEDLTAEPGTCANWPANKPTSKSSTSRRGPGDTSTSIRSCSATGIEPRREQAAGRALARLASARSAGQAAERAERSPIFENLQLHAAQAAVDALPAGSTSSSGRWARAKSRWRPGRSSLPSQVGSADAAAASLPGAVRVGRGQVHAAARRSRRRPAASARWPWPPVAGDVTVLPAFDDWNAAWEQFKRQGQLPAGRPKRSPIRRRPPDGPSTGPWPPTIDVPAGGSVEVPFLLAWHYPNKYSPGRQHNYGVRRRGWAAITRRFGPTPRP